MSLTQPGSSCQYSIGNSFIILGGSLFSAKKGDLQVIQVASSRIRTGYAPAVGSAGFFLATAFLAELTNSWPRVLASSANLLALEATKSACSAALSRNSMLLSLMRARVSLPDCGARAAGPQRHRLHRRPRNRSGTLQNHHDLTWYISFFE